MKYIKETKILVKLLLLGLLTILLFSCIFYLFDREHFNGIDEENEQKYKFFHRFYFTLTTLSSAGYGDITPKSMPVKIIASILQFILIISLMSGLVTFCE
tara:strand:+ start:135 stop:434 length:300 start_codon:yes stop_codon:yes gene_type:complete